MTIRDLLIKTNKPYKYIELRIDKTNEKDVILSVFEVDDNMMKSLNFTYNRCREEVLESPVKRWKEWKNEDVVGLTIWEE